MKIDLKDVFSISEVHNDCRKVFTSVDADGAAVIYCGNKPKYVVLPYDSSYEIDDAELKDWDGSPEELEEINRVNEELLKDLELENNPVK